MEGLHNQAFSVFSQINFAPAPNEHELISLNSTADPQLTQISLPLSDILHSFEKHRDPSSRPIFRLVKLHIAYPPVGSRGWEPPTLNASKDEMGFRSSFGQSSPALWDINTDSLRFMISIYSYCVIWSYCPQSQATSGVIINRSDTAWLSEHFQDWWQALDSQIGIIKHPLCLLVASIMEASQYMSQEIRKCRARIHRLEHLTGYNPWIKNPAAASSHHDGTLNVDELSLASQDIGAVLVTLEDHARQLTVLRRATGSVDRAGILAPSSGFSQAMDVSSAMHVLRQQMDSSQTFVDFLRARAKNQLTVTFNLINRYDASAQIAAAQAAERNSTSMKTIAIMTMAFLPATFLAALFAVPSLPWNVAGSEAGSTFGIYWAFTIPSTIFVFVIWAWASGETLLPRLVPRPRSSTEPERGYSV
ncbi:hypothetical protein N656DRAFT_288020 [Canariomyces notabilis]|uniref:Uncharacterized protein n=1 Tax=Canariomyces notabilis TaxID=2074819 RepID=A0AAN6QHF0_9PEZI|nr:hypothetical protein N656DRAFT_288020 [Canariomyces arenarius]